MKKRASFCPGVIGVHILPPHLRTFHAPTRHNALCLSLGCLCGCFARACLSIASFRFLCLRRNVFCLRRCFRVPSFILFHAFKPMAKKDYQNFYRVVSRWGVSEHVCPRMTRKNKTYESFSRQPTQRCPERYAGCSEAKTSGNTESPQHLPTTIKSTP